METQQKGRERAAPPFFSMWFSVTGFPQLDASLKTLKYIATICTGHQIRFAGQPCHDMHNTHNSTHNTRHIHPTTHTSHNTHNAHKGAHTHTHHTSHITKHAERNHGASWSPSRRPRNQRDDKQVEWTGLHHLFSRTVEAAARGHIWQIRAVVMASCTPATQPAAEHRIRFCGRAVLQRGRTVPGCFGGSELRTAEVSELVRVQPTVGAPARGRTEEEDAFCVLERNNNENRRTRAERGNQARFCR